MTRRLKQRVNEDISRQQWWRAKERLSGAIGSLPYDEELYRTYAQVLFHLGDMKESGKYFLLSDEESSQANEAIAVFLQRCDGQLFAHFPKKFKEASKQHYPMNLKRLLENTPSLAAQYEAWYAKHHPVQTQPPVLTLQDKLFGYAVLFAFIVPFGIGVITILSWLVSLF